MTIERRLQELRDAIPTVTPAEARELQAAGAALIDVREADEIAQGTPEDAHTLGRGFLEMRVCEAVPEQDRTLLLMCSADNRSLLAADDLRRLGYGDVRVVAGGFDRWKDEGLPYTIPEMVDADARQRYARQIALPEVGEAGQSALDRARVLVIGAGGLGSPAALYLAAAGVGTLGVVDHDRVDRSNLQRQILHRDDSVGRPKTESARATLASLNPRIALRTHELRLEAANIEDVFRDYDVVIDGSDNFPTRYLVNDACVKLGLPNVYGAVQGFEGRVSVFAAGGRPCYRCLHAEPPAPESAPPCSETGVLGVVPGVIGMLQALEALKLIVGFGEPLIGRLLLFEASGSRLREVRLTADPECAYCAPGRGFPGYIDYRRFCRPDDGD
jgi:molybdopterin/thiamine biosynthesis adenylyltransferase/rhodanese-related sulfurtransferase